MLISRTGTQLYRRSIMCQIPGLCSTNGQCHTYLGKVCQKVQLFDVSCNQISAKISWAFFLTHHEVSSRHTRLDTWVTEFKQLSESRQFRVDSLFNSVMDRQKGDPRWHWYKTEGMMAQLGLQEVPQRIRSGSRHIITAWHISPPSLWLLSGTPPGHSENARQPQCSKDLQSWAGRKKGKTGPTAHLVDVWNIYLKWQLLSGKYNLVGAQPNPSTECGLRRERHISPSSEILGCHNLRKGQIFRL